MYSSPKDEYVSMGNYELLQQKEAIKLRVLNPNDIGNEDENDQEDQGGQELLPRSVNDQSDDEVFETQYPSLMARHLYKLYASKSWNGVTAYSMHTPPCQFL
ncbi:hypothetical protein INT45_010950 [Circinella minor]|uniref:Uncharacterized protein n=1 Tax=Circinella minor TaxID=1195481 RepID=A0A8H7V6A4_9FUNG|nr:hypothetical protein INT45_010950 [Circinella minor]